MGSIRLFFERLLTQLGFGMRAKLIIIFVVIKVIPLLPLTFIAWRQFGLLGDELSTRTQELTATMNRALDKTGDIAVGDSVKALNDRATEDIERMTTDAAKRVADFLYERDDDILFAAGLSATKDAYGHFVRNRKGKLLEQGGWKLAPDGKSWVPDATPSDPYAVSSSNRENDLNFRYRPPDTFGYENRPLYLEITFVDLQGNERLKITTSPRMDPRLKNVSDRRNTYVRAETYFEELKKLKPGEIYVSDVIGAYVPSRYIGMYTPENVEARGLPFVPEEEAYAGQENPLGKRFQGIVRWGTPVERNGRITGYVTLALDHDHIMEFTDHIIPTEERYTEIPSAYEGNYAFIWDYKCRSIVHPRHHSITGYDPETGDPQIPWLEESIYEAWQASGKPYTEFIQDEPTFVDQSVRKKPAKALTDKGLVGLDGRYLNFAPQCTGWFDLTCDGGSGSFVILWSGLRKLTTAAAIPYYTGQYGASRRGFGFVAIGAGLDDFYRPARETEKVIDELIGESDKELSKATEETRDAIASNLMETATQLSLSAGVMIVLVVFIAIWMASAFTRSITRLIEGISRFRAGERHFRFNAPIKDELGTLADSFDEMADSIVASVTGPLAITDMDRNILYMNDHGLAVIKKTLPEVLGKSYALNSIYPAGTKYCPIDALHENRDAEVMPLPEEHRYVRGNATYLTDKEGKRIGYIIVTTDVTEIALEQKKIEEHRRLLNTVFSSSPDLIWYKDAQGCYLAINPRFAAVAGKSPEEVVGHMDGEILPPAVAARFRQNDDEAVRSGVPLYTEERISFADNHQETLDSVRTPIYDENGELVGLLGVARDVSGRVVIENELRKTQLELERAVGDANRANEYKGEFLARMSHEIRTPMNTIIGMTNIVKRKLGEKSEDMQDIQEHVRQIEASSQHLLGLLNDILDLSKIEAGKIELTEEAVDLPKLAATVASIIRPRCEEKNIAFSTVFAVDAPTTFLTDSLRLRQVLINLLGNAVKFTPECGRIEFRIEQKERGAGKALLEFSVSDTGIGISEAGTASLFQPFEQGSGQISRRYGGTGLGLAISRNIVHLLGGEIGVQSREGEGSIFRVALMLSECAVQEKADEAARDATGRFAGKRALLVDDVPINRLIAMDLMSFTGIAVDEAEDSVMAVRMFEQSPPGAYDIVFMDVQMPNMNGHEAAAIRDMNRPDAKTVPIVALTANAFKEDIDKSIEHGMSAHLSKPLEVEKLLEVMFRFLEPNKQDMAERG